MSKYPEHDKLSERRNEHITVLDFVTFLEGKGLYITYDMDSSVNNDELVLEFLGVDKEKLNMERLQIHNIVQNGVKND